MTRAALALAALALPAAAIAQQHTMTYAWNWIEVNANSSVPVSSPNGALDPGEGARIRLTASFSPGVGSTITYTPPPAPGSGTVAGLWFVFFDLLQTNAIGGTWSNALRRTGFTIGAAIGGVDADGTLRSGQAGQFNLQNWYDPSNPVTNIWQATWNPSTYAPRTASFQSAGALAGNGNHSGLLVQYGPDPQNDPQYVGRFVPGIFGNTGPIPIVPAPATLLPLAAAAILARRHRPAAGAPS